MLDEPRHVGNKSEWKFDFSWPEIWSNGLVPQYTAWYMYPGGRDYDNSDITGWLHRFGVGYDLKVKQLPKNVFHLTAHAWYRDGMGGSDKDHDWSHATFGVSTEIELARKMSFVPALFYQSSWDESVNPNDEIYCEFSLRYKH